MLTYADVRALMVNDNGGMFIDFGGGNQLWLDGVHIADFDANQGDFLFA